MTQPDGYEPEDAANYDSLAAHAAKTGEEWQDEQQAGMLGPLSILEDGWNTLLSFVGMVPVVGPSLVFILSLFGNLFGLTSEDYEEDPGDLDLSGIWGNVVSIFINPLGFFANLIGGLLPNSQLGGHDASKITSGNFVEGIVTGLTDNIDTALGWVAGFVNAFTGQTYTEADVRAGNVTATDASVTAAAAAEAQLANSIAVAALQAESDGVVNSGIASADDFERVATTDINGADGVGFWAITLQSSAATHGTYTIADGHTAKFVPGSGTSDQLCLYRRTKPEDELTDTLYQKVGGVIGAFTGDPSFFSGPGGLRLRSRLNTGETEEVFCNVNADGNAQFGYRNGSTTDNMVGSPVAVGAAVPGTTWYLIAGTTGGLRIFQLLKNGGVVHSWTDGGSLSAAVDGTNNGWGWGGFAASAGGAAKRPPDVGIVSITDNTPATVIGTAAAAYRANTGTINCSSGAAPDGTFDTLEYASADITWNATTGEFTVTKASPYVIGVSLRDSANLGGSEYAEGAIYTGASTPAATLRAQRVSTQSGSGVTTFGPHGIFITETLYLAAGTVVRAGLQTNASARTVLGDAAGTKTRFTIAKVG